MAKINFEFEITAEDMSNLMVAALEGGINYWCRKVEVTQQPIEDWEFASDVIGLTNGIVTLTDDEDGTKYELTQEKFLKGVKQAMTHFGYSDIEDLMDNHDAETADVIIQFAIFDEIVFG